MWWLDLLCAGLVAPLGRRWSPIGRGQVVLAALVDRRVCRWP